MADSSLPKFLQILREMFAPASGITEATRLAGDMGLDAEDVHDLMVGCDFEFGVRLGHPVAELATVGEWVAEIDRLLSKHFLKPNQPTA